HRAMAARPSEQAPFSLQNFLQNLQDTIGDSAPLHSSADVTAWIPGSALRFAFAPPWDDEAIDGCSQKQNGPPFSGPFIY
ncbi:hypothetical protein NKI50_30065, partial [Mesorhizobium sp. M0563]|uniref:hypothetical protein n=1 Tax=Mesorhizobium sp. M0563 TaxID=2956959 RepID=UPI00333DB349